MNTVIHNESDLNTEIIFRRIFKMRFYIIFFISLTTAISAVYVCKLKNQYLITTVLRPNQNLVDFMPPITVTRQNLDAIAGIQKPSNEKVRTYTVLFALLYGTDTINSIIDRGGFEQNLTDYSKKFINSKEYIENKRYYISRRITQNISLKENIHDRIITLSFLTTDRKNAPRFINDLLDELSRKYKAMEDKPLEREIRFYSDKIKDASTPELKNAMIDKVMSLTHNRAMALSGRYYGFDVIRPPLMPDERNYVGPPRIKICVLVFSGSLILSVMCVAAYDILMQRRRGFK